MVEPAVEQVVVAQRANLDQLRLFAWVALILLVAQNLSGLYLNLYVALPIPSGLGLFLLSAVLDFHIANAFLLVVGGVFLLVYAVRTRVRRLRWLGIGALTAVVFALQEGFAFTFTQNNGFSFGMEAGFLAAMFLCGTILFLTAPADPLGSAAPVGAPSTSE
ncbi:MAG TPA: hypothetical protein VFF67_08845 [Thermoplasmata archaeon]|nr:hypothetical protein [Thermoplasmata archaeon]